MNNWKLVKELLEARGVWIARIDKGYSGRGMYGATTVGLVLDSRNFDLAMALLKEWDMDVRTDNMGMDFIIY